MLEEVEVLYREDASQNVIVYTIKIPMQDILHVKFTKEEYEKVNKALSSHNVVEILESILMVVRIIEERKRIIK